MNRRELVLLLTGALTAPRVLCAQHKTMPVIGYISSSSAGLSTPYLAAFRQGLAQTGYLEGQNVVVEYRWAEGRFRTAARIGRRSRRPQGRRDLCKLSPTTPVATVAVAADGSCTVYCGTVDMGQGCTTAMAQIAVEALGVEARRLVARSPHGHEQPVRTTDAT